MAETPYILTSRNFQRDGDGVRTTIFFKGCPLTLHVVPTGESALL